MALKWCRATITHKTTWAEGLFTLQVAVTGVQQFQPGQFLQIGYQNGEHHIHRPYSVASPWGSHIEFFVVRVDEGELTPWLWQLEPGASLDINHRASGSFTLQKTPDAEQLWLIATGTGLAPYIAMLRTSEPWDRFQRIVLVHGVRWARDLAYREELLALTGRHPGQFDYVPVLTRQQEIGALHGRIPILLQAGQLEKASGASLNAGNSSVMLCGNPAMLDDMERLLQERGMTRHRHRAPGHIVLERYW